MRKLITASGALLILFALGACETGVRQQSVHFSYEGVTGPAFWGDLDPDWILAKTGKSQSPIDITDAQVADVPALTCSYSATPLHIVNNGHAIQVNYTTGSSMTVGSDSYDLTQFHFHSPSEHTIEDEHAAIEVHLVHKSSSGDLAVIAVMINEGAENPFLASFWDRLPSRAGPVQEHDDVSVNIADLLPADRSSYRYSGSLTTPPCSEGVCWIVLAVPVEASQAQIDAFRAIISGNNRPIQRLHGREILMGE